MKKVFKLNFLGRDLIVETGELEKQADYNKIVNNSFAEKAIETVK